MTEVGESRAIRLANAGNEAVRALRAPKGPFAMRRQLVASFSFFLAGISVAKPVHAVTLYVSPTGTATTGCTRQAPCTLASAASSAAAGDTVILMDGVYREPLYVANSGTASAWITFQADECATPIIEGPGAGPADDSQDNGVHSTVATHVRFVGLVARGWNIGFGNGWTGAGTTNSNGNWEIKHCISYGNGRTGFTFFSAQGIRSANSIAAHNGSSTAHSWSSGITLYQAGGNANVIEGSVSFENMDAERNTDGSGFIVDEHSNGATFVNNLAFRNGGSCFRLTRSSGTRFINNTCYQNAQNSRATGPTNPGEIYFTDAESRNGVSILNNVFVATGTGPGQNPVFGKPTSGWSNNIESTGTVSYFTAPAGNNPDFTLASAATTLIGRGTTGSGVPTNDVGFDPRCIVKRTPVLVGNIARGSWWQYSIDIETIQRIGGVAKCFNPGTRSGTPDIGAYKSGAVSVSSGTCTAPTGGMGGAGGMAGAGSGGSGTVAGAGGASGGLGGASPGGSTSAGSAGFDFGGAGAGIGAGGFGVGGTSGTGGSGALGGNAPGGSGAGLSGMAGLTGGTPSAAGNSASGSAGAPVDPGGAGAGASEPEQPAGCGCRVSRRAAPWDRLAALGALGLLAFGVSIRRCSRPCSDPSCRRRRWFRK